MFGGAVSVKDSVLYNIGSQVDVAETVLAQLNIPTDDFKFSKNLLADSVAQFAYFSHGVAAQVANSVGTTLYDIKGKEFQRQDSLNRGTEELKAWLQVVDDDIR